MKLQRFKAKHFRCIYDSDWITITDPTVLIGCNDGGKTATFEAMKYVFANQRPPIDAYSYSLGVAPDTEGNRPRESEITIDAIFVLDGKERELLEKELLVPPGETIHIQKTFNRESESTAFNIKTQAPVDESLPGSVTDLKIGELRGL